MNNDGENECEKWNERERERDRETLVSRVFFSSELYMDEVSVSIQLKCSSIMLLQYNRNAVVDRTPTAFIICTTLFELK